MSGPCEIELDGKTFPAREGETILEVARGNGVFIPALCAHPLLKPYGACRLCLVEIRRHQHTRLVASCAYPVQAGLVVRTDTDKIRDLRRGIMELLLARCPGVEPVLELARRLGVGESRFPSLSRAGENCVLCGLCVRVCQETVGSCAIGFAGRGTERRVDSPFSLGSEDCLGCCACVAICPTAAIAAQGKADTLNLVPFGISVKLSRCAVCGKPFGPLPLLTLAGSRLPASLTTGHWCPECRAERRASALAAVSAPRHRRLQGQPQEEGPRHGPGLMPAQRSQGPTAEPDLR